MYFRTFPSTRPPSHSSLSPSNSHSLSPLDDSKLLLTGSADNSCKLWDVYTGKNLFTWNTESAVRSVAFAMGDKRAMFTTDAAMQKPCRIYIVPIATDIFDRKTTPYFFTILPPANSRGLLLYEFQDAIIFLAVLSFLPPFLPPITLSH